MRLKLKNTPEQIELVKAMGSKNVTEAREAQEAFAAFLGPVIQQVINQAATAGAIYQDASFDEDDAPSFPLDLYYDQPAGYVSTWSQSIAGGLPVSQDISATQELKIATYTIDSAVSVNRKYARKGRLDVVSKAVERMAQEVLVKQDRNAWAVVLKALGEGSTNSLAHIIGQPDSPADGTGFRVADLNAMMTRMRRVNASFAGGTPEAAFAEGLTDLFVSPEIVEDIRAFAYQPMNTRGVPNSDESTAVALPDSVRSEIYNNAGASEIYGVNITEILELGVSKKYNILFDQFDSSVFGASSRTSSNTEVVVGVDASKGAFIRAIAQNSDSGSTFSAIPDDQYSARQDKVGFYGSLEEGRVCVDARAIVGMYIKQS
jgi:hypothetical protein